MKKSSELFKTQTEQELHEIMGGKIEASAARAAGIAVAYGVGISNMELLKKILGLFK